LVNGQSIGSSSAVSEIQGWGDGLRWRENQVVEKGFELAMN